MASENTTPPNRPPPFVVKPTSHHTHTFILLHGLGSNGEEFGRQFLDTGICSDGRKLTDVFRGARFIFPTAKRRRSSAYGRAKLTQWFDIASLDDPWHRPDTQLKGLAESSAEILGLVNEEIMKIPRDNIIIGGLSHGCAMALSCLLALDFPLGGFIGMSGWLPFQPDIEELLKTGDGIGDDEDPFGFDDDDPFSTTDGEAQEQRDTAIDVLNFSRELLCLPSPSSPTQDTTSITTPVFLGHGDADEKIKPSFGENASATLKSIGYKVTWKRYKDQGHWYKIPDEIDDIVQFIQSA
ncbi:alpha/beta-hydrolase [Annulohypoxylon truncatum]|uniref:alpha/beta-hydrolase n=1 Tax=Annulohypoxylon truncatum TaxID=327061 RepID=UPI0020081200|nr:alpha/beta-hydrolase [Annulohypoxylon truncatum]KAI1206895.1 alpha/beta-hydrolase [Annulohypoxylon truncatum]